MPTLHVYITITISVVLTCTETGKASEYFDCEAHD